MILLPILVALLLLQLSLVTGNTFFGKAWTHAARQTMHEQVCEDTNSVHRIDEHLVRRLIVMPLTEEFNPNQASEMHGKIQFGDKCSLPASLGRVIFAKPYEVPWLFEVKPVDRKKTLTSGTVGNVSEQEMAEQEDEGEEGEECEQSIHKTTKKVTVGEHAPVKVLDKVYISPLDFRSPENYIFMPQWLMRTLDLKANDLVDISFVRINLAGLVVFQPCSFEWDDLMEGNEDPKTILEHEVNKYSSLTAGSTIYIERRGVTYPLYVSETRSELGVAVRGVRVQDSDVQVDIDRKILDEKRRSADCHTPVSKRMKDQREGY